MYAGTLVPEPDPERGRAADGPDSLFRLLVENARDVITVVDSDGRIVYDSPSVLAVLGYRPGELVGRRAFELIHPHDLPAAVELLVRTAAQPGTCASMAFRFRHRAGDWRVLEAAGRAVEGDRVVVTSRDVTDRERVVEQVRAQRDELEHSVRTHQEQLAAAQLEVLERLARAAECRDDDTGLHTRRVGALSSALAAALGMAAPDVDRLGRAAPLHDVGKIGIRDSILLKPGPLSQEELRVMRTHTTLGARILAHSRSELVRTAEELALCHHEQWDGGGYPRGLRREEIPLSARIVAVADFFDALSHARPYRPAVPRGEVVAQIRAERGRRFDPRLVDAFLDLPAAAPQTPLADPCAPRPP